MKKIIAIAMCVIGACLTGICEHSRSFMDNGLSISDNKKEYVIPLSASEWNYVKNTVDTNGWCQLPNFNLVLVVTNGLGEVGHNLPLFPPAAETCHPDKKTKKVVEPSPY